MFKIAITGPESSGKTTLARQLAARFDAPCTPEYARIYLNMLKRPYTSADIPAIARGQVRWEDSLQLLAGRPVESQNPDFPPLLICDTDMLVLKIWSEFKYGHCDPYILKAWRDRPYDLHLLCIPDIPWMDDPLREHPVQRHELLKLYRRELTFANVPYAEIGGSIRTRLSAAVTAILQHTQKMAKPLPK
jgi:NadR type nicotinamide-nucleotide adenylyltransferase